MMGGSVATNSGSTNVQNGGRPAFNGGSLHGQQQQQQQQGQIPAAASSLAMPGATNVVPTGPAAMVGP